MSDNRLSIFDAHAGGPLATISPSDRAPLAEAGSAPNPALTLHRMLRGRYLLVIPAALALACAGGLAGYFARPPTYTSTGLVRVAPNIESSVFRTQQSEIIPFYDAYVQAMAGMLRSRRIIDRAVDDLAKTQTGWPLGSDGVAKMIEALQVDSSRQSQLVAVRVEAETPVLAKKACDAVLAAFDDMVIKNDQQRAAADDAALERFTRDMRSRGAQLRDGIRKIAEDAGYATEDLAPVHAARLEAIQKLDSDIKGLETQITFLEAAAPGSPTPKPAPAGSDSKAAGSAPESDQAAAAAPSIAAPAGAPTAEDFAADDQELDRLLQDMIKYRSLLDANRTKFGPEHNEIKGLNRRIEALQTEIDARVKLLAERRGWTVGSTGKGGAGSLAQMKQKLAQLRKVHLTLTDEATKIWRAKDEIRTKKDELDDVAKNVEFARQRQEERRVEKTSIEQGRLSIASPADLPPGPSKDRRLMLAAMGAGVGGVLPIAFAIGIALVRGSYRYIDDVEAGETGLRLLGTLPDLSGGTPEDEEIASLAVHHLRNMLQLQVGDVEGRAHIFTVTSPSASDGKTSLTLALAMSFAVSGNRTLVLDADLVGRGLSRKLNLLDVPGLTDAIEAGGLNGQVVPAGVPNLWVLPAGTNDSVDAENLSRAKVRRIIDSLRAKFDSVIIDTGPLQGSLEANLVAPLSDRTILTISRGTPAKLVRATAERLRRIGAVCAGLVFNRAVSADMTGSLTSASISIRHASTARVKADSPELPSKTKTERSAMARAIRNSRLRDDDAKGDGAAA
ncbi:MAG: hypothetical protein JNM07_11565 [Phycisphaerae bacterium]|nr:hypothetical protein [Phycisphaerae bacterium]